MCYHQVDLTCLRNHCALGEARAVMFPGKPECEAVAVSFMPRFSKARAQAWHGHLPVGVVSPIQHIHTPSGARERGGQAVDTKSSGLAVFLGGFPIPSLVC